jgi:hypothetical protein
MKTLAFQLRYKAGSEFELVNDIAPKRYCSLRTDPTNL